MMPNGMPTGAPPPTGGAAPMGGAGGQVSPEEVKSQLVMILSKAKEMADANGINFAEILAQAGVGGGGGPPMGVPSPAVPPAPM